MLSFSLLDGTKEEQERSKQYECSAHIINIYSRGSINLYGNQNERNFLYLHDRYVHPKFILEHEHVILMGLDEKRAYFCIAKDGVDPSHSSIGPFLYANTFIAAEKLIILPIDDFHRLANERGDPFMIDDLKITIIHMTIRCGSTLLGQVLERVPGVKFISEPISFTCAHNLYSIGKISFVEYQHLLESSFRLQCKTEKKC